ncbi:MAG: MBOAT family O-acyltransferase [Oscillibacter sp.]
MLFNSLQFLLFFPIVTLLYFAIPHKVRWMWLLAASYYFYMCWNPKYAMLIGTSTVITYVTGLLIDRAKTVSHKKIWVGLSFGSNLLILFFFKYFDFAIANINALLSFSGLSLITPAFDVLLPVGISFYTFQALSYTMDVYRGDIYAEKNLGKYALFVSFFPQLVAGPIERSKNLLIQISEKHVFSYENMTRGLQLMLWGFFQKLVIADRVAIIVNQVYNDYTQYAGFQIVLATMLFAVQIYCDFSGYSDIAIGAAQVMGFRLMDNFNRPYFAVSIKDFWRRWHISLSTWFKDYLYIPLGGNRCSRPRRYFNLMVTFLASGLWHGASWNFVIWGGLHGAYQIIGDLLSPLRKRFFKFFKTDTTAFSHKLLQMVTTFALVDFAWIFFRAPGASAAIDIIRRMFSVFNPWIFFDESIYLLGLGKSEFWFMLLSIGILFVVSLLRQRMRLRETLATQNLWFRWLIYIAAFYFVLYGMASTSQEFVYFQF